MIKNYPRITTNYGSDRFEFNYEVKFNYSHKYTRTYSGKMQVNQANALNIAETIDEITNASIKTIYDTASHMLYQINLDDDKCVAHNLKNKSINYFYIQDSFVKKPELYYTKSFRYSYLGEYKVDDVDCLVFEEKFRVRPEFDDLDYYENETNESTRKNKNNLDPITIMSTHYYPKKSNYWSSEAKLSVPKRIEIRLFVDLFLYGMEGRVGELGRLTIDLKSIDSNAKEQDKYDTTKCTEVKRNS